MHPECPPEVVAMATGAGSTSYLIKIAKEYAAKPNSEPLIIGTESNLVQRLAQRYKGQCDIQPLFTGFCPDMNAITEEKLLHLLQTIDLGTATPLKLVANEQDPARAALTRMFQVCAVKDKNVHSA